MEGKNTTPATSTLIHPISHNILEPGHLTYRYWTTGCLRYEDIIPDGFYDLGRWRYPELDCLEGKMPSLQELRERLQPTNEKRQIIVVDHSCDPHLVSLEAKTVDHIYGTVDCPNRIEALAQLVSQHLEDTPQESFPESYHSSAAHVADIRSGCSQPDTLVAIGTPRTGASARHRALLFKALAPLADLRCRLVASPRCIDGHPSPAARQPPAAEEAEVACVVLCNGRQCSVDLTARPGALTPLGGTPGGIGS
eukprot:CAMPEP_0118938328 /NCGR_PEP_ID=MMETSP1169-20130426/25492_1 /TAXON_ID=36882 /ORGANISM="Pyramimonas obovata, Strain CCMP722" /LENGTH=251 /DNA_ID=CAMNT_0006882227 /DNA_START=382 /DNA_END=1134 /DNA_ORIENTATION=+